MILLAILAALHITAHVTPLSGDTGWDYITTDPAMHRVFVAHGDRITVIDSATHKEIGTIPANRARAWRASRPPADWLSTAPLSASSAFAGTRPWPLAGWRRRRGSPPPRSVRAWMAWPSTPTRAWRPPPTAATEP